MAEVVGVVASSIAIGTLAAQITSSIVKLKSYWDQVQGAPEDVRDLIEELDILANLLTDMEDDQRQNPVSSLILDSTSKSRCLQHCKRGADQLKELTESLSVDLDSSTRLKRKWASAKVVLKKDKVDRYRLKLERAIRLLSLSHQLYTRALLQLQPDIIVAKLSQVHISTTAHSLESPHFSLPQTSNLDGPLDEPVNSGAVISQGRTKDEYSWTMSSLLGTVGYSKSRYSVIKRRHTDDAGRKEEREEIIALYRSPTWLVNRAWRIQATKACFGWTFSPRTYNVIPPTSPVFRYVRNDDVRGLQDLFSNRLASPSDCDERGETLLHYAAWSCSLSVCKLLVEMGLDPNYRAQTGLAPIERMKYTTAYQHKEQEIFLDTLRLLLRQTEIEPELSQYGGPKEGFLMLQQHTDSLYYEKPLEERIEVATSLVRLPLNGPDVLKIALARDGILPPALFLENLQGETLLHIVATSIASLVAWFDENLYPDFDACLKEWRKFLKELIGKRLELHAISFQGHTPFLNLLKWFFLMYPFESTGIETALASLLNIWLEDLQESGVDLEEYGRKETELNELTNWCFFCYEFIGDGPYTRRKGLWVVKNLTYGPSPSDWKLEVEWQIVDATEDPKKMPGGWIEEDDSGGDESQVEEDQDSDEVGSEVDEEEEDKISDVVGNEMREGG